MSETQDPPRPIDRRRFIFEQLQDRGELTLKAILEKFPGTARQSIKDDIQSLTDLGFDIKAEKRGRETVYEHQREDRYEETAELRLNQKNMVASLAAGIICGFTEDRANAPQWCLDIHSAKEVMDSCRFFGAAETHWLTVVRPALLSFWHHTNRLVAIDAGSTNLQIGKLLKHIKVPCVFSELSSLSVCTNGRNMFQLVGDKNVRIRAIVVGGQQIRTTSIIAGRLAEEFLTHSSLTFAVSFIGATAMNVRLRGCETNTQEEVGMKALFMEKSRLKIVCLDNEKIVEEKPALMRSGFNFTTLHPGAVDLVITNRPLRVDELSPNATEGQKQAAKREEETGEFEKLVLAINNHGVPCMVAQRGPLTVDSEDAEEPYRFDDAAGKEAT